MADWSGEFTRSNRVKHKANTLQVANGERRFNAADLNWLDWLLKGNETARAWFASSRNADGWVVGSKSLASISVKPLQT